MIGRTHSRAEQALALALLLAVPLALAAIAGPAILRDHRAIAAEIASLDTRYAELARRQRDLGALVALRDRLRAADPAEFGLLATATVELARVEIERQLREVAARNGARLSRTSAIESADPGTASAAVSLSVAPDALPPLLVDIANAKPLIFIDVLSIRHEQRGRSGTDEAELEVYLALSSYTTIDRPEEPK